MPDSWKKNRRNPRKLTLELIQTISSCIARHVTTSFDEYDKRVNKYVPEYTVHKNKMFTDMITHVMVRCSLRPYQTTFRSLLYIIVSFQHNPEVAEIRKMLVHPKGGGNLRLKVGYEVGRVVEEEDEEGNVVQYVRKTRKAKKMTPTQK